MFATLLKAIVLVSAMPAAAAREPEVLPLSSKWVVNYDENACHLAAQFGTGDDHVVARITRYRPGEQFDLALSGRRFRDMFEHTADASIDFGMGKHERKAVPRGKVGETPAIFFTSIQLDARDHGPGGPPRGLTPQQEAAVAAATVAVKGERDIRLEFTRFGKAMEAMRACTTDLVKHWGYDPQVQATLRRPAYPVAAPSSWLRSEDYPRVARMRSENGLVQFRLDVGPDGKVLACHVLARTQPDHFGEATCEGIARRAKLEPALDAEGKPVRSYFVSTVRWKMG
jgi:hypothetical protein